MNIVVKRWKALTVLLILMLTALSFTSCDSLTLPGSMRALTSSNLTEGESSLSSLTPLGKAIHESPMRLMTSRQYFVSFLSVTGIQRPKTRLLERYNLVKSVLPTRTDLSLLNAPIAMGLTNLAGATCEQMYDDELGREPASRFFLQGNDHQDFSSLDVKRFSQRLALAAWGEALTAQEESLFDRFYIDFASSVTTGDSEKKKAKGFLVSVCTAIVSSPKSIVF